MDEWRQYFKCSSVRRLRYLDLIIFNWEKVSSQRWMIQKCWLMKIYWSYWGNKFWWRPKSGCDQLNIWPRSTVSSPLPYGWLVTNAEHSEVHSGVSCLIPVQDQRNAITRGFKSCGWMIISNWPCAGVSWYKWSVDQPENKDNSTFFSLEKVLLISIPNIQTINLSII